MKGSCRVWGCAFVSALLFGCTYAFTSMPLSGSPQQALPSSSSRSPSAATALSMQSETPTDRRGALMTGLAAVVGGGLSLGRPGPVEAAGEEMVELYVGAGCFWHVQHEVTEAERKILGRKQDEYTAVVGYAGGTKTGKDGKVCYHNLLMDSDYGRMGHTEVVVVKVPKSKVSAFADLLIPRLFVKGIRADPQDRGGEYRSALGLPGGMSSPFLEAFKTAGDTRGMTLVASKGDEGDTLKDKSIQVYDTAKFPFYPGEVYHQYHDDMVEKYGKVYGALREAGVGRGAFKTTGCPEIGF
eukprot:CAMPEP_0173448630 /NCGR_PEP_ID=MMETSP1357-20121228/41140_1 /TAXON_ID=77926 /ORGANISM="Hemiselmis rufescens, Strain PCC563" /LENGTH=297 /DNA_ID=CAMNT_0014415161 /DNA_START=26 /DNA_END=919 /DNA_ORIENTATION=-